MRHECFSQIGFRKTDSDIYGANSGVQCANSGFPCANIRVRGINSGFRGCAFIFYGVSSGQVDRLCFAE